jgi:hypothetical protein
MAVTTDCEDSREHAQLPDEKIGEKVRAITLRILEQEAPYRRPY